MFLFLFLFSLPTVCIVYVQWLCYVFHLWRDKYICLVNSNIVLNYVDVCSFNLQSFELATQRHVILMGDVNQGGEPSLTVALVVHKL